MSAGKLGLLPQRDNTPGRERYNINWVHQYLGELAEVAYPINVGEGITQWGMLGNADYGDCGPAAYAHETMLSQGTPTEKAVERLYLAYTHGQDVGVVIADFLLWLYRQKLIEGFAPVQRQKIDAVMATFKRGIILGVSLTDDDMDAFNAGRPWSGTTPDRSMGHAILKVAQEEAGGEGTIVTWGANQLVEGPWQKACIDEAWVIVTKEDMAEADYAALVADLDALPHATPAAPPVVPVPVPPGPSPSVLADVVKLLTTALAEAQSLLSK